MTKDKISIDTLLLAAGLSRRMGSINKLLIDIDGEAMARKTARLYQGVSSTLTVVLGHEAEQVAHALLDLDTHNVINPDYEKGQQSSVRYGLDKLTITGDAVLIGLADQHRLTPEDIKDFIAAYKQGPQDKIFIPQSGGQRGNPILFPAAIARQIQADETAPSCRKYIDENPDKVTWFKTQNKHFIEDLDTPEDAERYGIALPLE